MIGGSVTRLKSGYHIKLFMIHAPAPSRQLSESGTIISFISFISSLLPLDRCVRPSELTIPVTEGILTGQHIKLSGWIQFLS